MIGPWSPGARVGPYLLERELGRGGMGVVFLAQDTQRGAPVVIKTLTSLDHEEVARLEREGLALARLEHPNLVRVHAAGWHERRPYLVLQLARGGSLDARLQRGPLPWPEVARLGAQLASALAAAHAIGITHRDLKPQNVLLDERGAPLLADFGLAKVTDLSRLTETGTVLGTPHFMAPEQARGEDSGGAADVYSLGALLYAALAGRPPIATSSSLVAQLIALQEEEPPRLGSLAEVPPWLEDAIHAALSRQANDRPSSADLAALFASPPAEVAAPGRGLVFGVSVGVLLLSAILGGATWLALPQTQAVAASPSATRSPEAGPSVAVSEAPPRAAFAPEAVMREEVVASLTKLQARFDDNPSATAAERAFFGELSQLEEPELAEIARGYTDMHELSRQRRGGWAAIELARRGAFDWLQAAYRGVPDVRARLPVVTRLARSGNTNAQWLLWRIKITQERPQALFGYQDAQYYLHHATSLLIAREASPLSGLDNLKRATAPLPRSVGEAWLRIYRFEEVPLHSSAHRRARVALSRAQPEEAVELYLKAWEEREQDSESLAFELMVAAEWCWSRHLRALGFPYLEGAPAPDRALPPEALRAQMRRVLNHVTWGRGNYLLAVTYLPGCRPEDPQGPPPEDVASVKASVEQALAHDPGLSPARLLLAQVLRWEGDHVAARAQFRTYDARVLYWRFSGLLLQALNEVELAEETGRPLSAQAEAVYREALRQTEEGGPEWRSELRARYEALTRER